MNTLSEQILRARKAKGYSQNELAELTGLNIRTIQRIEKGQTEPRGHSLRQLFNVLDLDMEETLDYGKKENIGLIQVLHLSALAGLVVPLGNVIAPLMIWLSNKNKVFHLDKQAKNLIVSQLIISTLPVLGVIGIFIASTNQGLSTLGSILAIIFLCLVVFVFVYPLIVALLIHYKGVRNYYPVFFK